jgi:hypothetical protein
MHECIAVRRSARERSAEWVVLTIVIVTTIVIVG